MAKHRRIDMFRLSVLCSPSTGIAGAVIWFSAGEYEEPDPHHGPRLMVVIGDKIKTEGLIDAACVRLTTPPEVIGTLPPGLTRQVVAWVDRNRDALLGHWSGDLDSRDACDLLQRM